MLTGTTVEQSARRELAVHWAAAAKWWPSRGTNIIAFGIHRWLRGMVAPSASPSPAAAEAMHARRAGGFRQETTWAPALRPGLAPSAPCRSTDAKWHCIAATENSRLPPGDRIGAAKPHMCCGVDAYLLWSKNARPRRVDPVGGFGRYRDLGHTVRVALSQVRAWPGIRPAPKRARPVPILERDQFRSRTRLREGDTPDRGGRWTKTGKQRRNNRARGLIGQTDQAIGARQETGSRPGE